MNITNEIRSQINRSFFGSPRFRDLIWSKYYSPNKTRPEVSISEGAKNYLNELQTNGIVCIHNKYSQLADQIDQEYFEVLEGKRQPPQNKVVEILNLGEREEKTGSTTARISFRNPLLEPLLFDPDLCGIIYNYYRRQPYYRNQPVVVKNAPVVQVSDRMEVSAKFHTDGFRQISFMFLVTDLTLNDTHLEYAQKSHLEINKSADRYSFPDELIEKKYEIVHGIGSKGTLIIFDAGSGFHRGVYKPGTIRKFLHTNITTGHHLNTDRRIDSTKNWNTFSAFPDHVKRMMDKVKI